MAITFIPWEAIVWLDYDTLWYSDDKSSWSELIVKNDQLYWCIYEHSMFSHQYDTVLNTITQEAEFYQLCRSNSWIQWINHIGNAAYVVYPLYSRIVNKPVVI